MFPMIQLAKIQQWLRQRLIVEYVKALYLNQWWPSSLKHIRHQASTPRRCLQSTWISLICSGWQYQASNQNIIHTHWHHYSMGIIVMLLMSIMIWRFAKPDRHCIISSYFTTTKLSEICTLRNGYIETESQRNITGNKTYVREAYISKGMIYVSKNLAKHDVAHFSYRMILMVNLTQFLWINPLFGQGLLRHVSFPIYEVNKQFIWLVLSN